MEEGELDAAGENNNEEGWNINNVAELLNDYKSLKKDVNDLKQLKHLHPDYNLKSTVTDIVKSIFNEFKKETIQEMKKELKIDNIVSDVKNCTRVATSAKDKTLNVEKKLLQFAQGDMLSEQGVVGLTV